VTWKFLFCGKWMSFISFGCGKCTFNFNIEKYFHSRMRRKNRHCVSRWFTEICNKSTCEKIVYLLTRSMGGDRMDVEVFIGNLNDPDFKWEGGNWSGNCPSRISPFFPNPLKFFDTIVSQIDNNTIYGKQTDWGSWVAPLYPSEIMDIINNYYERKPENAKQARAIKRYINSLDSQLKYALVACEIS
jgi:hypothetical protein